MSRSWMPARLLRGAMIAAVVMALLIAGASAEPAVASSSPAVWLDSPVTPMRAERLFDRPPRPWAAGHRGIDLAAAPGQEVVAAADGVVTFTGTVVDRAVVSISHSGRLVSSVEPVAPSVSAGDVVHRGDVIGVVQDGPFHCASACVHLGVRRDGNYINPLDVLAGFGPIRLLPLR